MSSQAIYEQLDSAVDAMLRSGATEGEPLAPAVAELLVLAGALREVPRPEFRLRLQRELQGNAEHLHNAATQGKRRELVLMPGSATRQVDEEQILPTLFGAGYGTYPVHRSNFVVSAVLHAAAIALVLASSLWIARNPQMVKEQVISLIGAPGDYSLPASKTKAGGGGGGGDRDKLAASKGSAPRFAAEQITPPAIVIRNDNPKLTAEPTVVGPPDIKLPQTAMLGDPLSRILAASSTGTGTGGGLGSGEGGGVGSARGPGVGPGHGGGYGGGVYRVGGGVSAPRVIEDPDPEYSEEARQAKYQGTVVLWVVIGADGRAQDIRVQRSLGMGLDEKAIDAVRKWRFVPGMKDGRPVRVMVNIEVNFRLY